MSNKKKERTSNRTPRVPLKFNDHIVSSLGQKRVENVAEVNSKETENNRIGETSELDKTNDL